MDLIQQIPAFVVITLIKVAVVLAIYMTTLAYLQWVERKVIAHVQVRMGPSRVGPHGLLQPLADVIKLITKEGLLPPHVNKFFRSGAQGHCARAGAHGSFACRAPRLAAAAGRRHQADHQRGPSPSARQQILQIGSARSLRTCRCAWVLRVSGPTACCSRWPTSSS